MKSAPSYYWKFRSEDEKVQEFPEAETKYLE